MSNKKPNLFLHFWNWLKKLFSSKAKSKINTSENNKVSGNLNQLNNNGSANNISMGNTNNTYLGPKAERDIIITNNNYYFQKEKDKKIIFANKEKKEEFEKNLKVVDNYVFIKELALTLLMEKKEIIEHRWPKGVISSKEAKWSFRPNNDFYAELSRISKNSNDGYKDEIFVDGKWVKRREGLHVVYKWRHPGLYNSWEEYAEYKGEKEVVRVEKNNYYLTLHRENDLPIRTIYLTNANNINPNKFKRENKKVWKDLLEWLASLWNSEELFFASEEVGKVFFTEYNEFIKND